MKIKDTEYSGPERLIESGYKHDSVKAALKLLGRTVLIHNIREQEWRFIQDLIEAGVEIRSITGNRKITSKLLIQVLMGVVNKLKPLDFDIYGIDNALKKDISSCCGGDVNQVDNQDGMSQTPLCTKCHKPCETVEQTVIPSEVKNELLTDAVATCMDMGNYANALRDKGGAFYKMALFGDAFIQMGTVESGGVPVQFRGCSLSDVYVDNGCTDIRDNVSGLSANEICLIYRYSWGQFCNLYPEYKDQVVTGQIPRSLRWRKQLEKTWMQTFFNDEDVIEVGHYFNLGARTYTIFAGTACTMLEEYSGPDYPFVMDDGGKDGKAYIPVLHYKFFPSTEGFYNWGLGHLLYDIALLSQEMDNMAFRHASDNIDPINFVAVPQKEGSKIFAKIKEANEQRKAGGKGFAVIEYGAGDAPGRSGVGIENFESPPITEEWERAFHRLEQQITRLGFQIDAVDQGQVTATQVLSQEENSDQTVKQIMEFNASESKFAVEVVLSMIKNLVKASNKTPLHITTDIEIEGKPIDVSMLTLGAIKDELKTNDYFVRINSRSGTIPSNTMKRAEIQSMLPFLVPGSKAQAKAAANMATLSNMNMQLEDFLPQAPPQAPGAGGPPGGAPPGAGAAPPTDTDALKSQIGQKTATNPLAAIS
jgi:hypothetical protein